MELLRALSDRVETLETTMGDPQLEDDSMLADAWITFVAEDGSHI
jgi:hypothetical protein